MSYGLNYELIVKIGAYDDAVSGEKRKVHAAETNLALAVENRRKFIASWIEKSGYSTFEETNIACMAPRILSHVYTGSAQRGLGKRHCIFCGCDDFDD